MARPRIVSIYRYPVKGLSAQRLESVQIRAGQCLPLDRAYAVEAGSRQFDRAAPKHFPKTNFLMLMRHERLAALGAEFDDETHTLTLSRGGRQVTRASLKERIGRQILEQFFAAYMGDELRGAPRVVSARDHHFTDTDAPWISLVNLASVRELERVMERPLDPLRFRANLYVDGIAPWDEFGWLDRTLSRAGWPLFEVRARIDRCAATDVDPATGARDSNIPRTLVRAFGHGDMGIYLSAGGDAVLKEGDELEIRD